MQVDLLAFGPHPDDIEIGIGGTLAKHVQAGQRVGLCDLTRGELGSNGTVEQRRAEADAALQVLGATWRENLGLPDGGLRDEPDQIRAVAELIRRTRPRTVAAPYWQDRHPDHVGASRLVTAAAFRAGLRRAELEGEPFRPDWVCYYFINDSGPASFIVDVSAQYEIKRRALRCHREKNGDQGLCDLRDEFRGGHRLSYWRREQGSCLYVHVYECGAPRYCGAGRGPR